MSILVCGSIAYDTVMVFPGRFKDHILPDRIHMLNVAFLVPTLRRNFGGCAGNIAYNLRLLGAEAQAMAAVGHDFEPYETWMRGRGLSLYHVRRIDSEFTAQAYITTDLDDNQITAFHPGAMNQSHLNRVPSGAGIRLGAVSPDGRAGMLQHAEQFAAAGIPFLFDPGQGLPMFDGAELSHFIEQASWVAVNDYEAELLCARTGLAREEIAQRVQALIVTRGAQGSSVYAGNRRLDIPIAQPERLLDPTGCGDAYRAGLLFGLARGYDWETTGRIGALMGAIKIAHAGTQTHGFTPEEFASRFAQSFGYRF
jgi:adenosine kinase